MFHPVFCVIQSISQLYNHSEKTEIMPQTTADSALSFGTGRCLLFWRSYAGIELPGNNPAGKGPARGTAGACARKQGCHHPL